MVGDRRRSIKTRIKTGNIEGFFKRGRKVARHADQGRPILVAERVIAYEDPEDLAGILTKATIARFRVIKERPGSITDIAGRLQRDRSAVRRDIDALEQAGLDSVADKATSGHGRRKEGCAVADKVVLTAVFA